MKRELTIIDQDGGALVFDKSRGIYFQVNMAGAVLIRELINGKSVEELIAKLETVFSLHHEQATSDVSDFLYMLQKKGVIK
ncbi:MULTISPECIES: PqqD family protein [unclassified Enterococcus]|uniref:PqqD family protein n=1 Tax=unclassified Enterococcus TaxID=2608891 RepID=UPI0020CE97B8|nr:MULTISPECIES: PqqD family protein [unclassified Enterococcus]